MTPLHPQPLSPVPVKRYKQLLAFAVEALAVLGETEVVAWIEANLPPPGKKGDGGT